MAEQALQQLDAAATWLRCKAAEQAAKAAYQARRSPGAVAPARRQPPAVGRNHRRPCRSWAWRGGQFVVQVPRPPDPQPSGLDDIDFLVAGHAGSTRPIGKVASGGELSRIRWPLPSPPASWAAQTTLIFDEVDRAWAAPWLKRGPPDAPARGDRQVLAVTHLPQVVVRAPPPGGVQSKRWPGPPPAPWPGAGTTSRVAEMARMLGGESPPPACWPTANALTTPPHAAESCNRGHGNRAHHRHVRLWQSIALRALEDAGYCVDNLPPELLLHCGAGSNAPGNRRGHRHGRAQRHLLALVPAKLLELRRQGCGAGFFSDATTGTLAGRFPERCRRIHCLATGRTAGGCALAGGHRLERDLLAELREQQAQVIDSSTSSGPHAANLCEGHDSTKAQLSWCLMPSSWRAAGCRLRFFDVRMLPNPHYETICAPSPGVDAPVAEYLDAQADVARMIDHISQFLESWLARLARRPPQLRDGGHRLHRRPAPLGLPGEAWPCALPTAGHPGGATAKCIQTAN